MGIAITILQWLGVSVAILVVLESIIKSIVSIFNITLFLNGTIRAVAEYQQAKLAETLTGVPSSPEGFQYVEGRQASEA